MAVSLKIHITAPVFWRLRFQCASQSSGICGLKPYMQQMCTIQAIPDLYYACNQISNEQLIF